jgi:hypothetical protein
MGFKTEGSPHGSGTVAIYVIYFSLANLRVVILKAPKRGFHPFGEPLEENP